MNFIDLHAHMVSRTTDDYERLAQAGCVAVTEPAFWPGWDRSSADGFADYFRQLTDFEPRRAARSGIAHFTWLCLNPKEAENRDLARAVLARIPEFLDAPTVLGIGEIGLNRVTVNELATFRDHVEFALDRNLMILIHTPHLEDKHKGTRVILDALGRYRGLKPGRVLIDHAEEHTIEMILERGYWTGLTLYPRTKMSPARAVDLLERFGPDRLTVSSACDWGPSQPLAVPQVVMEMRRRGHRDEEIRRIVLDNPAAFLAQSPNFRLPGSPDPVPARDRAGGRAPRLAA